MSLMYGPDDSLRDAVQRMQHNFTVLRRQVSALRRLVYAGEAERMMARRGLRPRYPVEFRSQFGEDVAVYDAFGGATEGFFIEVGAFDGYEYSVTYALECLGWSGLLVEAIPEKFEACRARRQHSRVVHAALSAPGSPPTAEFTVTQDQFGGMLSYLSADALHLKAVQSMSSRKVSVPVTTLDALLADETREIDVAVIDVEGGEPDLLRGFDLRRHRPKMLFIEDNHRAENSPVGQMMAGTEYGLVSWLEATRVYVRKDLDAHRRRLVFG